MYEFGMKTSILFPDIFKEFFRTNPNDLAQEIKQFMTSSIDRVRLYSICSGYGMIESVKWLMDNNFELERPLCLRLLKNFPWREQIDIADSLLKIFLTAPFLSEDISLLVEIVVRSGSLDMVQYVFSHVPSWFTPSLAYLMRIAIDSFYFLTFDFLYERFGANFEVKQSLRFRIIVHAMQSRLPEAKVREYIRKFGFGLVGFYVFNPQLIEAAATDYLDIIKEYGLCNVDNVNRISKIPAITKAFQCKQTAIVKCIIDSIGKGLEFGVLFPFLKVLVELMDREHLRYLVASHFDIDGCAEIKSQIIILLTYESRLDRKGTIRFLLNFCLMMGWTRLQWDPIAKTSKPLISYHCYHRQRFKNMLQDCLDSLPNC